MLSLHRLCALVQSSLVRVWLTAATQPQVSLLVGGPDWPTSVITGILRQNVVQMMLGTVPILGPVACTVISGGCLLRSSEGNPWTSLASLFMTLSAASLGGAFIAAMLQIDKIVKYRKADIDAIPDDEEVKVMDRAASIKEEAMASVSSYRARECSAWRVMATVRGWQHVFDLVFLLRDCIHLCCSIVLFSS